MSHHNHTRVRLGVESLEDRANPSTFVVTNNNDSGVGSLRYELGLANAAGSPATVTFDPSLTAAFIDLTTVGDTSVGPSAFVITNQVTIEGSWQTITRAPDVPGLPPVVPEMRLFTVAQSGNLTLENLTLSNGYAHGVTTSGGGFDGLGGAIYSEGTLTVTNSTLTGNRAKGGDAVGGTPMDFGTGGDGWGGAIFNQGGTLTLTNTTLAANVAVGGSGAGLPDGIGHGGGIMNLDGTVSLTNDTIAGNVVGGYTPDGGALYNLSLTITFAGEALSPNATVTVANTLLVNSAGGSDLVNVQSDGTAAVHATGPNLVTTNVVNVNGAIDGPAIKVTIPNLGPLQFNGGLVQTMLPQTGSPAINGGSTAAAVAAGLTNDERGPGFARVHGEVVDVGAVEVQPIPAGQPIPPPPLPYTIPPGGSSVLGASNQLVVSGVPDGTAQVFAAGPGGVYGSLPTGTLDPFGGIGANVRTATGDVDGDGVPDTILVTGPGVPIRVAVVSGADNRTVLVAPFDPFGGNFTGGGFVTAGDFDGYGRAAFVVTPDEGGGPRVTIFSLGTDGAVTPRANFFGIDDLNFRGGARVAAGDVNLDGTPDLIVSAGFGGGPRTAIFSGATVLGGSPTRLVGDFFAFPGSDATTLRNGTFVAAADVDGDGFADLIFGGGPGGAPRVFVLSGRQIATGNVAGAQANPIANFFADSAADRGGARVAALSADGDGLADVAVGTGVNDPSGVRVYAGQNLKAGTPALADDLSVFGGFTLADGVYVG